MPVFQMPKAFDEIREGEPLPEGIYSMHNCAPIRFEENKAKTGMNIILELETFGESDPTYNGRTFMAWISMPTPEDENRRTKRGQSMTDFKMQQIRAFIEAVGGTIDGASFELPDHFQVRRRIIQKLDPQSQRPFNDLEGDWIPFS